MSKRPADVDVKQSIKDLFLTKNEYKLVDDYVIKDGKKHPFALLVPGGGYGMVCSFIEGVPIARMLNKKGISAFILYYRVREKAIYPLPMNDLAKAVSYIFVHHEEYKVETENYSIWGASAGGHLAASFGCAKIGYRKYGLQRPDTIVLAYPVISMDEKITHKGSHDNLLGKEASKETEELLSIERQVDEDYPRTYLWNSDADKIVDPENSKRMAEALKEHHIEHIYRNVEDTPHGVGPRSDTKASGWIDEAVHFWLKEEER